MDEVEYNTIGIIYRFFAKRQQEHKYPLAFFLQKNEVEEKKSHTQTNDTVGMAHTIHMQSAKDRDKEYKINNNLLNIKHYKATCWSVFMYGYLHIERYECGAYTVL